MSLTLISPPEFLPISLAELKAEAGLDAGDTKDDARLMGCLRAAISRVDGVEGLLGKALISQTWQLLLPAFPCHNGRIDLPLPPLQQVLSVTYTDPAGDEQTLAADQYQVVGVGYPYPAWVAVAHATAWPATRYEAEAVRVTYTCGYGPSWNDVPEGIRHSLMTMAVAMYDGCDPGGSVAGMISAYKTRVV